MPAIAAAAGLAALAGAKAGFDQYSNEKAMRQQQKYTRENMETAFQNSLKAQKMATPLAKMGMLEAGFSPSVMAGSPVPTATPSSVPSGDAKSTTLSSLSDIANMANLENQYTHAENETASVDAQIRNTTAKTQADITNETNVANAQVNLMDAQAKQQNIQNARDEEEDKAIKQAINDNLQDQVRLYESFGMDSNVLAAEMQRLQEDSVNLGTWRAHMKAMELNAKNVQTMTIRLEELFKQKVANAELNNKSYSDIAKMPKLERELTEKFISQKMAEAYYLTQEGNYAKENLKTIAVNISKMRQEINNLVKEGKLTDAQRKKIENSDIPTLIKEGNYGQAAIAGGVEAGVQAAHGLGFGGGLAVGSRVGGSAGGAVQTLLGRTTKTATSSPMAAPRNWFKGDKQLEGMSNAQRLKKITDKINKMEKRKQHHK